MVAVLTVVILHSPLVPTALKCWQAPKGEIRNSGHLFSRNGIEGKEQKAIYKHKIRHKQRELKKS